MGDREADLERDVCSLLNQGRKIEAVKLYKEQTGVSLAAAKDAVESLQAGANLHAPSGNLEAELLQLLGRGEKLAAIKLYRETAGVSLFEAKQAVESLAVKHGLGTGRSGCLSVLAIIMCAAICLTTAICCFHTVLFLK